LVNVTLTNATEGQLSYWTGGPGRYPDARYFKAHITDSLGNSRQAAMSNGQYNAGSGGHIQIRPGGSTVMPAALAPQPAGEYSIQIGAGNKKMVTIKDDPQLLRERETKLIERIRNGEPFAQHVASKYASKSTTGALLDELFNDDPQVVYHAAFTLSRMSEFPPTAGDKVHSAVRKILTPEQLSKKGSDHAKIYLAILAGRIKTDSALAAVLMLTRVDYPSTNSVEVLAAFKQSDATNELYRLLGDKREEIRFSAARVLGNRKDPRSLEVLLDVAENAKGWRAYACQVLAHFPNDPRVVPILRKAIRADDQFVRQSAQRALELIEKHANPEP
jgi:hypothetical protein